ncbi:MAG: sodium:proton antiporter, partial [Gemmatimonadota bacterium]
MPQSRRILALAAVAAVVAGAALVAPGEPFASPSGEHYGFASVLPALFTLLLVFLTREVITALFLGILVGGAVSGQWNVLDAFLIPAIGSESFAFILLVYLWA